MILSIADLYGPLWFDAAYERACAPEYIRVRERLAQAYRGVGRIAEAEVIDADLRKILAVATDDHPMKRRLSRTGL